MPKHVSTTKELRAMSATELRKDIEALRGEVAKTRLAVQSRSEKDTAASARGKKQLARTLTVLRQIEQAELLNKKAKTSKVPAPVTSA
jgi:ribosomal protein L29